MSTIDFEIPSAGALLRSRTVGWPLSASVLGRVPIASLGLVVLLHARALGASYAVAGATTGALGVGLAAGGPLLGRLADRRGAPRMLVAATAATVVALLALAALPRGSSPVVLGALAALVGAVHPPLGGIVRSAWPRLLAPGAAERIYAIESSALELTYIAGPALLGGALATRSTSLALVTCAAIIVAGVGALLADGDLRRATAVGRASAETPRRGAMSAPGIRVLTFAFVALGASLGAIEVAVAAAATGAGHRGAAGILLALWGFGSLLGGAVVARRPFSGDPRRRLVVLAGASALLHGLLVVVLPLGLVALGAMLLAAGVVVAPGFATAYGLTARIAPPGTTTEAFTWLSTGISIGAASGAALAGVLVGGPGVRLALAAGAITPLLAAVLLRWRRGALVDQPARAR